MDHDKWLVGRSHVALNDPYYAPVKLAGQFAHPRCTNRVINHSSCFVVKTLINHYKWFAQDAMTAPGNLI